MGDKYGEILQNEQGQANYSRANLILEYDLIHSLSEETKSLSFLHVSVLHPTFITVDAVL